MRPFQTRAAAALSPIEGEAEDGNGTSPCEVADVEMQESGTPAGNEVGEEEYGTPAGNEESVEEFGTPAGNEESVEEFGTPAGNEEGTEVSLSRSELVEVKEEVESSAEDEEKADSRRSMLKRKEAANRQDDSVDVGILTKRLDESLKLLMECATGHLTALLESGTGTRRERNNLVKKYHGQVADIFRSKLNAQKTRNILDEVCREFELKMKMVEKEIDDVQFMAMVEEFEENAEKEVEKRSKNISMDLIDQEEKYQECLEILNKFVDRGSKSTGCPIDGEEATTSKKGGTMDHGDRNDVGPGRHSEGLEALSEYIPTRDPLTHKHFRDPHVNRICRHVYEYESICEMMQGGRIKCPYPGCSNKKNVTPADLLKDEEMSQKIAERIRMEALMNFECD